LCADRAEAGQGSGPVPRRRIAGLVAGPLAAGLVLLLPAPEGLPPEGWAMVAVTLWMVLWWLSQALPLAATALLPVVLMPLLGLRDLPETAARYANPLIFLFLGGFLLALALERVGLHRRIALRIVAVTGTAPRQIVLGFMLATAFLSMWISNTATAILMFAVAIPVIGRIAEASAEPETGRRFGIALMLSIAYAASIGGVATLIGTPPNALLASFLLETTGTGISFARWMLLGLPLTLILLPLAWLLLTRGIRAQGHGAPGDALAAVRGDLDRLGPMDRAERFVAVVFAATAAGWILREPLVRLTGLQIEDATVAMTAALILFAVPMSRRTGHYALDWKATRDLPWGILILVGGGLALADGFASTGLADWIGSSVAGIGVPVLALVLAVLVAIVFLTEVTSNTASTATFLPILAAVALGLGLDPMVLTVPVALGASMAFMMPVATPPNAIVFAYEGLDLGDMVRAGIVMNLVAITAIYLVFLLLGPPVLGIAF